jgi:hypothetical protein
MRRPVILITVLLVLALVSVALTAALAQLPATGRRQAR